MGNGHRSKIILVPHHFPRRKVGIMNCPSRPDEIEGHPDWNQNPHVLSSDLTTRADLNGLVNLRAQRGHDSNLDTQEEDRAWMSWNNASEGPSKNETAREEEERERRGHHKRLSSGSKHGKRTSLPHMALTGTKHILVAGCAISLVDVLVLL